ncbi:MAG: ATP-binding protein [Geobacteraceae bacterium]
MSDTNTENQLRLANTELSRQIALREETVLERERNVEALQDSEKRYRRLFESAKDGILILDADTGKVVDVNPFLLKLLGYSYDAICGQYIWELGVFKDIAASKEAFKALQENEYIRYDDLPLETFDRRPIAVEFVSNVYIVDHAKVIQCNIRDITERKRANTEHLRLTAQFQQAQKMEAVGLLAGGVAHDYNNMLTVILGYAELALRNLDPAQTLHADLEEIIKAAKRSADITRQLLAFARKQTISPVVVDLNQTVESMLKMLRRLIGEDIDLAWLPEVGLCPVKMDPVQVDQILANLCVNARDAIADGGKVTIETGNAVFDETYCADHAGFVAGEYVLLAVSDDGSGMDKDILDQIFEPFFTSKGVGQGTGLGLSTVYGIVKQNNGFINVYSEPGKGTTFRIYLPRYAGQAVDVQRERAAKIPLSRGETVLVVEDEPAILKMGKMMLEELGYQVLAAGTPGEAISLAEEQTSEIHLLITDVVMPEMNGRDLAVRLQSLYPNIKNLFMSGYTANVMARRGVLDEGMNFIEKPFSMNDLAVKVREALRDE